MALATRCPNCQAMFRVVSDQLKLRGGLVRCGNCRHVFDAIGSLSYIEDASLALAPPNSGAPPDPRADLPAESTAPSAAAPASATPTALPDAVAAVTPPVGGDAAGEASPASAPPAQRMDEPAPPPARRATRAAAADTPVDPLAVPTLLAPNAGRDGGIDVEAQADRATITDGADAAVGEVQPGRLDGDNEAATAAAPDAEGSDDAPADARRARRGKSRRRSEAAADAAADAEGNALDDAAGPAPEPAFLRESRRPRGFSIVFGGGSLLLALLLLLQSAVMFRTELVTRWPQLRPQLVMLCDLYGCNVGWPTRAELLAVVGTELQAVPGTDILELTAVVRNRASFRVALPAVEVTLTDTTNRTLARKVFAPVDYLASSGEPSSRISEGLGAGSDYVVKIVFEARGLNAAGFVVYPFYL